MPPNTLRVHMEYVLVTSGGPKVLWAEPRVKGTGESFPSPFSFMPKLQRKQNLDTEDLLLESALPGPQSLGIFLLVPPEISCACTLFGYSEGSNGISSIVIASRPYLSERVRQSLVSRCRLG
ncbi:hypothetical protein TNCV_579721 [Trichonephila clavipes]|nr:hypothetical protein TNCV_579721 [Trichonephila clavipes]